MPITPHNSIIYNTQTQQLESAINNAWWRLISGLGSLSQGSNSFRANFSPGGLGTSTIRAYQDPWTTLHAQLTKNWDKTVTINSTASNKSATFTGTLNNLGEYLDWKLGASPGGFFFVTFTNPSGENHYIQVTQTSVQLRRSSDNALLASSAFDPVTDTFRVILVSDGGGGKLLRLIKKPNTTNEIVGTTTATYASVSSITLSFANAAFSIGTTLPPPTVSTLTYEETTVTVIQDPATAPPVANFTVPSIVGLNQNFTPKNNTTGSNVTYEWDKDNNGSVDSTAFEPTFSYSTLGFKTIKLTATNPNGSHFVTKTIEVMDLQSITFVHKRPLDITFIPSLSVFEPIEGEEEVAEDKPLQLEFNMSSLYVGDVRREDLWSFLYAHRLRQPFLWYNPERNETLLVKLVSFDAERQMLNYGTFEFVLRKIV